MNLHHQNKIVLRIRNSREGQLFILRDVTWISNENFTTKKIIEMYGCILHIIIWVWIHYWTQENLFVNIGIKELFESILDSLSLYIKIFKFKNKNKIGTYKNILILTYWIRKTIKMNLQFYLKNTFLLLALKLIVSFSIKSNLDKFCPKKHNSMMDISQDMKKMGLTQSART